MLAPCVSAALQAQPVQIEFWGTSSVRRKSGEAKSFRPKLDYRQGSGSPGRLDKLLREGRSLTATNARNDVDSFELSKTAAQKRISQCGRMFHGSSRRALQW